MTLVAAKLTWHPPDPLSTSLGASCFSVESAIKPWLRLTTEIDEIAVGPTIWTLTPTEETEIGIRHRPGTGALEIECPRLPDRCGSTETLVIIS